MRIPRRPKRPPLFSSFVLAKCAAACVFSGVKVAVRKIMGRIRCVPPAKPPEFEPPEPERLWLADTMDWNRLWADNDAMSAFQFDDDPMRPDSFYDPSSDFSPDL